MSNELHEAAIDLSRIKIPKGEAFSCGRCNTCCKGPWIIGITADEADRLRRLYPDIEPSSGTETLRGETLYAMARTRDGSCVYLNPDGCRVQKEHGAEAKPAVCHRFPYFPRAFGDQIHVHLSRMCPTAYDGKGATGEALARQVLASHPDLAALSAGGARETVKIAGSAEISKAAYLDLEERLVALILDDRWSLDDVVAAGYWLVQREANNDSSERPFPNPVHASSSTPDSVLLDDRAELVMTAIAKRQPMVGLYRYVMAATVTIVESGRGRISRFAAWRRDLALYARLLLRRGDVLFRSIEKPVSLRKIAQIPWPRRSRPDLAPVRRYLVSHIRHKLLLEAPDVEYAYNLLIGAYAAIKFYARASAVAANRPTLTAADVRKGVEIVEYNLLLHRPLEGAALDRKIVRGWFRKFLFHPSFSSSMIAF